MSVARTIRRKRRNMKLDKRHTPKYQPAGGDRKRAGGFKKA
jgi:hypothetical protein